MWVWLQIRQNHKKQPKIQESTHTRIKSDTTENTTKDWEKYRKARDDNNRTRQNLQQEYPRKRFLSQLGTSEYGIR